MEDYLVLYEGEYGFNIAVCEWSWPWSPLQQWKWSEPSHSFKKPVLLWMVRITQKVFFLSKQSSLCSVHTPTHAVILWHNTNTNTEMVFTLTTNNCWFVSFVSLHWLLFLLSWVCQCKLQSSWGKELEYNHLPSYNWFCFFLFFCWTYQEDWQASVLQTVRSHLWSAVRSSHVAAWSAQSVNVTKNWWALAGSLTLASE